MENQRQKELLTTLECVNYKKSSQQLPSCVMATRDSLFCKMCSPLFCFEQEKALKNFSKKLYTNTIKKREEAQTKNSVWNLKNALKLAQILEPSSGTRQVCVSVYFLFWSLYKTNRFHVAVGLFSNRSQRTPAARVPLLCFFFCDLLLNRRTATWNLFVKYITRRICVVSVVFILKYV